MLRIIALIAFASGIAASGATPDVLLDQVARRAAEFAEEFPAIACTERVSQTKFAPGPKVLVHRDSVFDYLVLLNTDGGDFTVEESRLEKGKPQKEPSQPLLTTTGFAALLLVFHPYFQSSYHFELLEQESRGGVLWQKVRFEHVSGRPSPTVLEVKGREYPIAWRGTAWIDPAAGMVGRIEAELMEPLEDIGLQTLRSEVDYAPAAPGGVLARIWLPRTAVIEAHTQHQNWRNRHEFSEYRRFDVNAVTKVEGPKEQ